MYRLILPALLVFACGSPAAAQLHKHFVAFKCEGQPDKVHSRRDERYFGCVNGRVACSDDGVSSSMIAAYENRRANMKSESNRRMRELDAKHAASHGSTTGSTARRTSRSSSRSTRRSSSRASAASPTVFTIQSAPRPPAQAEPLEPDTVRQVTVGTSADDVVSLLGQPKWPIAGSSEKWTYSLTSGGSAKLVFEDGKVTSVVVP